jgi:acyl-CoA thioester hydrolase
MVDSPFRSSVMTVRPEWIDYNGHMNMGYYAVLFDEAGDEIYPSLGLGPSYRKTGFTTYTAEFHVCYLRELHLGDAVTVTLQLLDFDARRFHYYQEIHHKDGWCAATAETMALHVDQSGPKVVAMPDAVLARLDAMKRAHATLPWPERAGRSIGIPRK